MLKVKIATPEKTLFNDELNQIIIETVDGVITVLPRHVPVISAIKNGFYMINKEKTEVKNAMLIISDKSDVTILISEL